MFFDESLVEKARSNQLSVLKTAKFGANLYPAKASAAKPGTFGAPSEAGALHEVKVALLILENEGFCEVRPRPLPNTQDQAVCILTNLP